MIDNYMFLTQICRWNWEKEEESWRKNKEVTPDHFTYNDASEVYLYE